MDDKNNMLHNEQEPVQERVPEVTDVELELCQVELAQWKEKYLYLAADFDTFRRRMAREADQRAHAVAQSYAQDIVSFVDDFERSFSALQKEQSDATLQQWLTGFAFVEKSLQKLLAAHDITEITETTVFNPQLHEALMQVAVEGKNSGEIVAILQKGYMLKNHVLRPARVSVAQ